MNEHSRIRIKKYGIILLQEMENWKKKFEKEVKEIIERERERS